MKYYSETLNELFDTEKDLIEAETRKRDEETKKLAAEKAQKEARAKRAKEVEEALKIANDAQVNAINLLKEFTKDYGYFHTSYSINDAEKKGNKINPSFFDILTDFLGS